MYKKHPIELLAEDIENKGLKVIEDVRSMPVYGEPYISPNMIISLNHSGSVVAEYDMQQVVFSKHDVAMVHPYHTLKAISSTTDYRATLLIISGEFLKELLQRVTHMTFFEFYNVSKSHLTDLQFDSVLAYFKMLETISQLDHPARKDMLIEQINIGTRMCDHFINENERLNATHISDRQQLLTRFYNAIIQHYRESREVSFYANLLCLSPKHFGTIIRQTTGVGAGEWIARYVIIQAKTLLRQRPDLSIQQVSQMLNFSEQTSFCRFFRKYAGITPKEYRQNG